MDAFQLGIKLGMELLGHRESRRSALVETPNPFAKVVVPIYFPTSRVCSSIFNTWDSSVLFVITILKGG